MGHRAVKRITNPMLGFKSFWSAQKLIAGIETMHMVKMGQLHCPTERFAAAADQFYSLAFYISGRCLHNSSHKTLLRQSRSSCTDTIKMHLPAGIQSPHSHSKMDSYGLRP
jgi:hypothetical protein